ncbi:PrsW family intramembrane metalloprotease [Pontiella sp.]|uniref:PrsW family intramembrane metalloprotease n=1 Tax=Pontiella sp. TaxID=2837462 RepID=UPI0035640880
MLKLILIALSFFFGLLSIRKVRSYDVHEAEPFWKMAAVTVWGGMVSVVISLFLYNILHSQGVSVQDGVPFSYFFVGFIEEFGKLLALFLCWPIIKNEMDEPTDGPIYIACVALGFSLIENYFYAAATPLSSPLIAIRLVICTPMHVAFSMIMGLAFYWAVKFEGGWGILLGAFLAAGIYHALYNIFVSYWYLLPGVYLVLRGAYRWMHQLLGYTTAQSPYRITLADFISGFPSPEVQPGVQCLDCGDAAPKPTYEKGQIRLHQCEACGAYVCSVKTLHQLIHHYGSVFGNLKKEIGFKAGRPKKLAAKLKGVRLNKKRKIVSFNLKTFNNALEELNRDVIRRTEKKWWCLWRCQP